MDTCCHKGSKLWYALASRYLPVYIDVFKVETGCKVNSYKDSSAIKFIRDKRESRDWVSYGVASRAFDCTVPHFFMGQVTNKPQVINYFIPTMEVPATRLRAMSNEDDPKSAMVQEAFKAHWFHFIKDIYLPLLSSFNKT